MMPTTAFNPEYNPESILILYTNPQNGVSEDPLILSPDGAINDQLEFSMDFDLGTRLEFSASKIYLKAEINWFKFRVQIILNA